MRLTYILPITVAVTLHSSATAVPSVKFSKATTENGIVDSLPVERGRMLRWVKKNEEDYDDDDDDLDDDVDDDLDDDDEEIRLGVTFKKANPLKLVKKGKKLTAEQAVKQVLKDGADYQKMIDNANKLIHKDYCWHC